MEDALARALDRVLILSGGDPDRGKFLLVSASTSQLNLAAAAEALNERYVFLFIIIS